MNVSQTSKQNEAQLLPHSSIQLRLNAYVHLAEAFWSKNPTLQTKQSGILDCEDPLPIARGVLTETTAHQNVVRGWKRRIQDLVNHPIPVEQTQVFGVSQDNERQDSRFTQFYDRRL